MSQYEVLIDYEWPVIGLRIYTRVKIDRVVNCLTTVNYWSLDRKILPAQKLISVKCAHFNLKCVKCSFYFEMYKTADFHWNWKLLEIVDWRQTWSWNSHFSCISRIWMKCVIERPLQDNSLVIAFLSVWIYRFRKVRQSIRIYWTNTQEESWFSLLWCWSIRLDFRNSNILELISTIAAQEAPYSMRTNAIDFMQGKIHAWQQHL